MKYLALFVLISYSAYLDYRFGRDYGDVFYDYSGRSNHGINGNNVDSKVTKTDRGIYLTYNIGNYIQSKNSFILPEKSYFYSWTMITKGHSTFFTKFNENFVTFSLYYTDKIVLWFSGSDFTPFGNLFEENVWFLFILKYSSLDFILNINNDNNFYILSRSSQNSNGILMIGSTSNSMGAFIWNFVIEEIDSGSSYIGTNSSVSLIAIDIIDPCDFSTKDQDNGQGCLPLQSNPLLNSFNNYCAIEGYPCSLKVVFNCDCTNCVCSYIPSTNTCKIFDFNENKWNIASCKCTKDYVSDNLMCAQSCSENKIIKEQICVCKTSFYEEATTGKCVCQDAYYIDSDISGEDSCMPCHVGCSTCSSPNKCETCKSENSFINVFGLCACNPKYFSNYELTETDSCQACKNDCLSCINSSKCTKCLSNDAFLNKFGSCECNQGYFNTSELDSSDSCSPCMQECSRCNSFFNCTQCISINAGINEFGNCECKEGFYNKSELTKSGSCLPCEPTCKTCNSRSVCLTCIDELASINSKGECIKNCDNSTQEQCFSCNDLCEICELEIKCLKCVSNSHYYNDSECKCDDGYQASGKSCKEKYFYANISISSQNKIKLTFTEQPKYKINENYIEIKVDDTENEYFLKTINISNYFISPKIKDSTIKHQIEIKIITGPIISKNNSMLKDYTYTVSTVSITSSKDNSLKIVKSKATAQAVTSAAACASLISNPSALWSLLNTIQLITFMPLNSIPYSENFKRVAVTFINYNIAPNLFEDIILPNSTSEPHEQAKDFGITTSVILLNGGRLWTIFLFCLFFKIGLFLLSSILKNNIKLLTYEKKFRHRLFMVFWIQGYLELVIYAFIQLKTVKFT